MNPTDPRARLAERIAALLAEGIRLDPTVLHYIDSTFCEPTPETVADLLAGGPDGDAGPLIELIFFPDEAFQARLEPLLEAERFIPADEGPVLEALRHLRPETRLHFPDGRETVPVRMDPETAGGFVARLRIGRNPAPILAEAVSAHADEDTTTRLKVRLRNCRFPWTGDRVDLMVRLSERLGEPGNLPLRLFDFALSLLHELPADADLWKAAEAKKAHLFSVLRQSEKAEEQRRKHTVEALILRGVRLPVIDHREITEKIALLDDLCATVFGRVPAAAPGGAEVDLGEFRGGEDMGRIIRLLS